MIIPKVNSELSSENSTIYSNQDRVRFMLNEIKRLPQEEQSRCLEIALRCLDAQTSNVESEALIKELRERITSYSKESTKTIKKALVTTEAALGVAGRATAVAQGTSAIAQDTINVANNVIDIARNTQDLTLRLIDLIDEDSKSYNKHINDTLDRMGKIFDEINERENKLKAAKSRNLRRAVVVLTPVFFFPVLYILRHTFQRKI